MPKGFLVKRSKKAGPVSYRVRDEDGAPTNVPGPGVQPFSTDTLHSGFVQRMQIQVCFGGQPESFFAPSLSPTRPDIEGYTSQFPSAEHQELTSAGSRNQAGLFFEPVLGGFAINGSPVSPSLPEMTTKLDCSAPKRPAKTSTSKSNQSSSKKRKSSTSPPQERKASCRDEVTTSPVLGLRIKEDPEDDSKQISSSLAEFICQLCKERYSDPLSLAHHKCSRIMRVDYRCTECDKSFSCPANLASHRRWHKPKGEENPASVSVTAHSDHSDSSSEEDAPFSCSQCAKKFRKQAYLRKHLALHERKAAGLRQDLNLSNAIEPVTLSKDASGDAPNATSRERTDAFLCRFCGENFTSSPGLTRHINKYHPTESRQIAVCLNPETHTRL